MSSCLPASSGNSCKLPMGPMYAGGNIPPKYLQLGPFTPAKLLSSLNKHNLQLSRYVHNSGY